VLNAAADHGPKRMTHNHCVVQGTQGLPTGRLDRHFREGVVFVTYSTLISKGSRDGRGAAVPLPNEPEPVGGYANNSDNEDGGEDDNDEFGEPGAQPGLLQNPVWIVLDVSRASPHVALVCQLLPKTCILKPAVSRASALNGYLCLPVCAAAQLAGTPCTCHTAVSPRFFDKQLMHRVDKAAAEHCTSIGLTLPGRHAAVRPKRRKRRKKQPKGKDFVVYENSRLNQLAQWLRSGPRVVTSKGSRPHRCRCLQHVRPAPPRTECITHLQPAACPCHPNMALAAWHSHTSRLRQPHLYKGWFACSSPSSWRRRYADEEDGREDGDCLIILDECHKAKRLVNTGGSALSSCLLHSLPHVWCLSSSCQGF